MHGAHSHSHHHGHSSGHGHHHAPADFGRAFLIGVVLNTGFVILEAVAGWFSGSLALLADAGHNLSDVAGLLLAWAAAVMAKRKPSPNRTYGLGRTTILASLANALLLLTAVAWIVWEAAHRFMTPQMIDPWTVASVAAAGIAVNAITAWLFASGRHDDLNVRGAYLHMMADAAVSLGVVIAAVAVMATGWLWIDPLVSIVIALVIAWGTWSLLAESTQLAVDGVPHGVDLTAIGQFLKAQPGVSDVHDLHVWALSTTSTALTAHLVRPDHDGNDAFLSATADALKQAHGISHVTLQIENQPGCTACCQFKAMANSDDDHHEGCGHDHHDHGHL